MNTISIIVELIGFALLVILVFVKNREVKQLRNAGEAKDDVIRRYDDRIEKQADEIVKQRAELARLKGEEFPHTSVMWVSANRKVFQLHANFAYPDHPLLEGIILGVGGVENEKPTGIFYGLHRYNVQITVGEMWNEDEVIRNVRRAVENYFNNLSKSKHDGKIVYSTNPPIIGDAIEKNNKLI